MRQRLESSIAQTLGRHGIGVVAAAICAAVLLSSCAPMPPAGEKKEARALVFPGAPEEPRFVYERSIYSSGDIIPDESGAQFRRMITGELRSGEGLAKPYAVAVYQGRIFLSDSVERFIKVFDVPNGRYYKIGVDDPGQLSKPLGIDIDRSGVLYVADANLKTIMLYDKDGKFLRKVGGAKWFDRLTSVTVDPKGERIYAVDIGGVQSEKHQVRVFDARNGQHLFDIGKRGRDTGEFNLPRDVAIGNNGELYVVDGGNFRVQAFDRDGKYLRTFGTIGRNLGSFARPKEVATDREGNVYVVDTAFGNFQIFTPKGELLLFVGDRSEQDGPAKYMLPSGIYVDEDGRVYMVDQWFRKVDVYRPVTMKADEGFLGKRPLAGGLKKSASAK
jgi:DNA-binding beta-propeller fold protein YncE